MVQGKRQVVSFKTKKRKEIDSADWIVVEGTHEPIVSRELRDSVHMKFAKKEKVRATKKNTVGLFAGRIFCADCKSPLAFNWKPLKSGDKGIYRCSRYNNKGGHACSLHYIDESFLSNFALNDIRLYARLSISECERMTKQLLQEMNARHETESRVLLTERNKVQNRLAEIASRIKSLYEDKCTGKVPEQLAIGLINDFATEQQELEERRRLLSEQIQMKQQAESEVDEWMDLVGKQIDIEKLDRATVMELIDRIEVSEAWKVNGERIQEVSIQYRFVGNLQNNKEGIA